MLQMFHIFYKHLDPPNFPITLQLPKNKNNICQKLYTGFTSCLICCVWVRYLHTKITCTFGGKGLKEREMYLNLFFPVGLRGYFWNQFDT